MNTTIILVCAGAVIVLALLLMRFAKAIAAFLLAVGGVAAVGALIRG